MYDIIGDTHGHARRLQALLTKLGYSPQAGVWRHPQRKALFLGDFVDRGPEQLETVQMIKAMVETHAALALLGNHEFNAVAFAMEDPTNPGGFLRTHTLKNRNQHQQFLDQVGENSALHHELLDWFKTLPLAIELDGLRAVHACWHPACLQVAKPWLNDQGALRDDTAWILANRKSSVLFTAVETLLKGVQAPLPHGMFFVDKEGVRRTAVRARWWDRSARTYAELGHLTEDPRHVIPSVPVDASGMPGYDNAKLVFFGHYWLDGTPRPIEPQIACLDYSETRTPPVGKMCAYRWLGETELDPAHFVWV